VVPTDLFDYLDWQQRPTATARAQVVRLADRRGAAPASMNRRIAAVRGLFEYAVISGLRVDNPVPAARRSSGLRAKRRGSLGHIGSGRPSAGGRLVREPHRLPESLDRQEISDFLADLGTYRDRDGAADGVGRAACRGDPLAAAGRRGYGAAPGPGDRQRGP